MEQQPPSLFGATGNLDRKESSNGGGQQTCHDLRPNGASHPEHVIKIGGQVGWERKGNGRADRP